MLRRGGIITTIQYFSRITQTRGQTIEAPIGKFRLTAGLTVNFQVL